MDLPVGFSAGDWMQDLDEPWVDPVDQLKHAKKTDSSKKAKGST